jgi:hypothetical protein
VRGREVYILDSNNLYIREGGATTCPFGHPHYQVTGERARVVRDPPGLLVSAWDVRLRTGRGEKPLPLFHPRFLSADLGAGEGYLLSSVRVGTSSKFGPFVQTDWRPAHIGWAPWWLEGWELYLDYYGDRGPAVGTELDYAFRGPADAEHQGFLNAYFVRDSGDEDDTGRPVPKQDRGRLWLWHRADWDERWRTDAEFHWLSDSGFLNEYFEGEFRGEKAPESYLFTRYRTGNAWAGLLVKERVNDFLTQVEESPSLEFQWIGAPGGALVHDTHLEAGHYDLEFSDELAMADPPAFWRLHGEHRVSLPFRLAFVRLEPFARAMATWVSEGALFESSQERRST